MTHANKAIHPFPEFSTVELSEDIQGSAAKKGMKGVLVDRYENGYEIVVTHGSDDICCGVRASQLKLVNTPGPSLKYQDFLKQTATRR